MESTVPGVSPTVDPPASSFSTDSRMPMVPLPGMGSELTKSAMLLKPLAVRRLSGCHSKS
jgi:hypothetical protein